MSSLVVAAPVKRLSLPLVVTCAKVAWASLLRNDEAVPHAIGLLSSSASAAAALGGRVKMPVDIEREGTSSEQLSVCITVT